MKKRSKIPSSLKRMNKALHMELREHKSSFAVYFTLRLLVILIMILQFFNKNYENVFLCILTLILLLLPSLIQVNMKIELPTTLEIIILLFIFSAEILGEISAFYLRFPFWDTMLHTLNGFLAAAIGFSLVDILNRNKHLQFELSPLFLAIVGFAFSMAIGVVWEFFECAMDLFLGFDMQKDTVLQSFNSVMLDPTNSNHAITIDGIKDVTINGESLGLGGYLDIGLLDTMKDLFVNFIGAVVFSFLGYFYSKKHGQGRMARRFIPKEKESSSDFMKIIEAEEEKV